MAHVFLKPPILTPCSTRTWEARPFLSRHSRQQLQPQQVVVCLSTPEGSAGGAAAPAGGAGGEDTARAALLARIAKAKQYKSGQGAAAAAPTAPAQPDAPPPSPLPSTTPRQVDWGAVAGFLDSQGRNSAEADGSVTGTAPPGWPRTAEEEAALQAAEQARLQRFEAAKDKMSDEYSPMDTDTQAFTSMVLGATQAPGRGSAERAAPFLQGVLSEQAAALTADLDAASMRAEEFTAAKEAKLRQLGVEILTVDPTYRAGESSDGGSTAGNITATTRNTGSWRDMLGLSIDQQAAGDPLTAAATTTTTAPPDERQSAADDSDRSDAGVSDGSGMLDEGAANRAAARAERYQPKVSTWGVFPRPKDISQEFGGGRNIKPGQELETKEQRAAREAAYAEALRSYKAKAGLEIDEEAEAQAQALYDEGLALFAKADLQGAYLKLKDALDLVPIKSRVGGLAGLQCAIILDSQGLSEEAQKLYRQLQGHAVAVVARKAKQMLFGFKAAKFLKADTISYAAKKGDFDRYFRPIVDRNTMWVPSEEEKAADEAAARQASLIAVAVLVGPVALIAALIAQFGGSHAAQMAAATAATASSTSGLL